VTIKYLGKNWHQGIEIRTYWYEWLNGRANRLNHPLSQQERLNIETNGLADVIRMDAIGPKEVRSQCAHWALETIAISIHGTKITSNMKQKLQSQLHDGDLRDCILEKEEWTKYTFNNISWEAYVTAFCRLCRDRRISMAKAWSLRENLRERERVCVRACCCWCFFLWFKIKIFRCRIERDVYAMMPKNMCQNIEFNTRYDSLSIDMTYMSVGTLYVGHLRLVKLLECFIISSQLWLQSMLMVCYFTVLLRGGGGRVGTDHIRYSMSCERAMWNGEQAAPENLHGVSANKNGQKNRFSAAKGALVSGKETNNPSTVGSIMRKWTNIAASITRVLDVALKKFKYPVCHADCRVYVEGRTTGQVGSAIRP
jgi:hypothetical protein